MIEQEIYQHKYNLKFLIDNLINTQNINEENMINNEIKKESEFITSLLNIKENSLMNQMNQINQMNQMNQNNNLNFDPMNFGFNINEINQPNVADFNINEFNNNIPNKEIINIYFERKWDSKAACIISSPEEKISDLVQKYRMKFNDYGKRFFIYSARQLDLSQSISDFGIKNGSKISVIKAEDLLNSETPKGGIKLRFVKQKGDGQSTIVGIMPNDKFQEAIDRFNNMILNKEKIEYKFYYNENILNPSLTLTDNGITQDCDILYT